MTYGEYHYKVKHELKLKNGVWTAYKPRMGVPTRMSTTEASKYYTLKLREYWESVDDI
jgi:hypothetical protein